jgi:hypothetical protein
MAGYRLPGRPGPELVGRAGASALVVDLALGVLAAVADDT